MAAPNSDIADHIISSGISSGVVPEGYYVDDLGYWVEDRLSKKRQAEYALFRIQHNPKRRLFMLNGYLFDNFNLVTPTCSSIALLYDCPSITLNISQVTWVYNRLKEMAPPLSDRLIRVSRDKVWDMKECVLIDIKDINNGEDTRG